MIKHCYYHLTNQIKLTLAYLRTKLALTTCHSCNILARNNFCELCIQELTPLNTTDICHRCLSYQNPESPICYNCSGLTLHYDSMHSLYNYCQPLNSMLKALKYKRMLRLSIPLGKIICDQITSIHSDTDIIIPMPLSYKRLKERRFNQVSALLYYYKRKYNKIPIKASLISRNDSTKQSSLSRSERLANIQGVFKINKPVSGLKILIIDDVVTTSETVNELAKTLKEHGALRVDVICLMRKQYA